MHSLFSHNKDKTIALFKEFSRGAIKQAIVKHLKDNPDDTIEHQSKNEIINFYEVNPKSGEVSLILTKGNKDYFKSIEND